MDADYPNTGVNLACRFTTHLGGITPALAFLSRWKMPATGEALHVTIGEGDDEDFAPSEMVLRMTGAQVAWLENAIDGANARLAPLTSFVLPGGSEAAARLHVARAAARRAERAMTAMAAKVATNPQALAYINRLSDLLFVGARRAAEGQERSWKPQRFS